MGKKHETLFFVTLWVVWCMRNDAIFNNSNENIHTSVAKIFSLLKSCEVVFSPPPTTSNNSIIPRSVAWSRHVEGTVFLNVNGSLLGSTNTSGYGGQLRNNNGTFLLGFYVAATAPSILFAELMAMLHRLQICWESGYKRISCFSDSLQAVNLIRDGASTHHRFANEVFSIRQLLERNWEIAVEHTVAVLGPWLMGCKILIILI
ncbi:hypothetical protein QL285_084568 [Trifolium repens]|nr:hypothetical protein QL285_084568 [Trifolium repens]